MLIKKNKQLRPGTLIYFTGPDLQNVNQRTRHNVVVKEVYSHWVLGHIVHPGPDNKNIFKISMMNSDLYLQGVYKKEDIIGPVSISEEKEKELNLETLYDKFLAELQKNDNGSNQQNIRINKI